MNNVLKTKQQKPYIYRKNNSVPHYIYVKVELAQFPLGDRGDEI